MAKEKKSFILYTDLIHTVRKMPKDKAGELFLVILQYVNDENPVVEDMVVDLVFEPIKRQMKRDLKKYEGKKKQWSDAGKASAEAKRLAKEKLNGSSTESTDVKDRSTDSTVNDNDIVTVNVNDTVINSLNLSELEKNLEDLYNSENWKGKVCSTQKLTTLEFEKIFQHFRAKVITAGELKTVGMLQAYFASYLPKYRKEILNDNGKQGKYTANNSELDELSEIARQQLNGSLNTQG